MASLVYERENCGDDAIFENFAAGMFCRLQIAGCRLKFNYNWKTAGLKIINSPYTRQGLLHKVAGVFCRVSYKGRISSFA